MLSQNGHVHRCDGQPGQCGQKAAAELAASDRATCAAAAKPPPQILFHRPNRPLAASLHPCAAVHLAAQRCLRSTALQSAAKR